MYDAWEKEHNRITQNKHQLELELLVLHSCASITDKEAQADKITLLLSELKHADILPSMVLQVLKYALQEHDEYLTNICRRSCRFMHQDNTCFDDLVLLALEKQDHWMFEQLLTLPFDPYSVMFPDYHKPSCLLQASLQPGHPCKDWFMKMLHVMYTVVNEHHKALYGPGYNWHKICKYMVNHQYLDGPKYLIQKQQGFKLGISVLKKYENRKLVEAIQADTWWFRYLASIINKLKHVEYQPQCAYYGLVTKLLQVFRTVQQQQAIQYFDLYEPSVPLDVIRYCLLPLIT